MPDTPSLAVIVVSYNVREELDGCLRTLVGRLEPLDASVTVVDNASDDGTPEMVRQRWPQVTLVTLAENAGFARANNVGIRATEGEMVLLLNPDTIVPPGSIQSLATALAAHPEAAAAGPRLIDTEGRPELSSGWAISPLGELRQKILGALYRRRFGPVVRSIERSARTFGRRQWVSGACLLVRRRDLEAVGLLDERYFMYTEDVDLCVALSKRGRAILFVPDAEVVHARGRSAGRNPVTEQWRRQSQLAYYEKHHPAWLPVLKLYLTVTGKRPT